MSKVPLLSAISAAQATLLLVSVASIAVDVSRAKDGSLGEVPQLL